MLFRFAFLLICALTATASPPAHDVVVSHVPSSLHVPLHHVDGRTRQVADSHLALANGLVDGAWSGARLGSHVLPMHRPDVHGVAYFEVPVVSHAGEPVGYMHVATGEHDVPVSFFTSTVGSQSALENLDTNRAAKVYKIAANLQVAEDVNGNKVDTGASGALHTADWARLKANYAHENAPYLKSLRAAAQAAWAPSMLQLEAHLATSARAAAGDEGVGDWLSDRWDDTTSFVKRKTRQVGKWTSRQVNNVKDWGNRQVTKVKRFAKNVGDAKDRLLDNPFGGGASSKERVSADPNWASEKTMLPAADGSLDNPMLGQLDDGEQKEAGFPGTGCTTGCGPTAWAMALQYINTRFRVDNDDRWASCMEDFDVEPCNDMCGATNGMLVEMNGDMLVKCAKDFVPGKTWLCPDRDILGFNCEDKRKSMESNAGSNAFTVPAMMGRVRKYLSRHSAKLEIHSDGSNVGSTGVWSTYFDDCKSLINRGSPCVMMIGAYPSGAHYVTAVGHGRTHSGAEAEYAFANFGWEGSNNGWIVGHTAFAGGFTCGSSFSNMARWFTKAAEE